MRDCHIFINNGNNVTNIFQDAKKWLASKGWKIARVTLVCRHADELAFNKFEHDVFTNTEYVIVSRQGQTVEEIKEENYPTLPCVYVISGTTPQAWWMTRRAMQEEKIYHEECAAQQAGSIYTPNNPNPVLSLDVQIDGVNVLYDFNFLTRIS